MGAKLVEEVDYYFNEKGLMVLTAHFLRNRGYCCGNGCRHCPYPKEVYEQARLKKQQGQVLGF
jgi:hypothetical protein